MLAKTSIALVVTLALASGALAAPKHQASDNGPKVTMPSATPEGNRAGWVVDW
jgi:hypothetical protein